MCLREFSTSSNANEDGFAALQTDDFVIINANSSLWHISTGIKLANERIW